MQKTNIYALKNKIKRLQLEQDPAKQKYISTLLAVYEQELNKTFNRVEAQVERQKRTWNEYLSK